MSSMREPCQTTEYASMTEGGIVAEGFAFMTKGAIKITTGGSASV